MKKIVTILGTRPEIIKLSKVIPLLDKYYNHTLIHTGQNFDYELNEIFFKDLHIRKPNFFLNVKSSNTGDAISKIIKNSFQILQKISPDAVLIYGDTNSCLSAISAKKLQIPIIHMEAGNRCFDQRVPEEVNRKIIDHISDINLVISDHAKTNLINEGLNSDRIFKTGSHMFEVISDNLKKINNSKILSNLKIKKNEYFVVSIHREENVDYKNKLKCIMKQLDKICERFPKKKIIFSTHPRTKQKLKNINNKTKKNLLFHLPFAFTDYIKLIKNSYCTISDSGTIFEEASILKIPAITIRGSHERQEGVDSGSVIISDFDNDDIINTIKIAKGCSSANNTADYFNKKVSSNIVKIIDGYISQVNKKIWYKN